MYRVGIDVGGTFTDLVAVDDIGSATLAKVPSTPTDPSVGVLEGLRLLADTLGIELVELQAVPTMTEPPANKIPAKRDFQSMSRLQQWSCRPANS